MVDEPAPSVTNSLAKKRYCTVFWANYTVVALSTVLSTVEKTIVVICSGVVNKF